MGRLLVEFVLRSVLIAAAAAAILGIMRIRAAAAQHAIWTGVLAAMLALPAWLQWGPRAVVPLLPQREAVVVEPLLSAPAGTVSPEPAEAAGRAPRLPLWNWRTAGITIYLLGAGVLLLRLAIGTVCANRLTSAACSAPVTVGLLRPRIVLPEGWREWPPAQLDAVLIHERAHARRRDPLVQWLALLNRALFWFHPLAWWLERRLAALAEEACDAAVLSQGHSPRDYAEYLLNLARTVERAGMRVKLPGMAMPGSHLPQRIRRMMSGAIAPRVAPARMMCAAVACAVCSATFAAGTLRHAARKPLLQAQIAAEPKFEVISIKPCKTGEVVPVPGRKTNRGGRISADPGMLSAECATLRTLIRSAYIQFANGKRAPFVSPRIMQQDIKGSPSWMDSDRYDIEAKGDGPQSIETVRGPMLQALLEERFQLKIHRETREMPIYELRVAKGGPRFPAAREGACISFDRLHPPPEPEPGKPMPKICGGFAGEYMYGTTMANLSTQLTAILDRDVIDKTGLAGEFDLHFEWSRDDLSPADAAAGMPPNVPAPFDVGRFARQLESAIPRLGLTLQAAKGEGEFLIIDHVEKPPAN